LIKNDYTVLSLSVLNSRHSVKLNFLTVKNIRLFLQLFCQSKFLKETFLLKPKEQQMGLFNDVWKQMNAAVICAAK
jgi:hypothetical protein